MRDFVAGIIGIATVSVFMGVVLWWVPALPLVVISIVVAAMLIFDFIQTVRYGENGERR